MLKNITKFCFVLTIAICSFLGVLYNINIYYNENFPKVKYVSITDQLDMFDLVNYNKVMIVAHPDDEMLWGGAHLIKDNYLVICITCGSDKERVVEFDNVMKEVNSPYLMLGYPDLRYGKRDDWSEFYPLIEKDIEEILNYKSWDMIVTHNPLGEYGHIHHIMTNKIVTSKAYLDNLYYFGIYYSYNKLNGMGDPDFETISIDSLIRKREIMKLYVSQSKVIDRFSHMHQYENFIAYKDWS